MRTYVVGMIAVLALALTSLGLAVSSPSGTASVAVRCSKAEGIAAVKRLGLRDASPSYPVYKVLCGAFTGAGSQAMVASISGPDNVGMIYWAVFRWSGSEWQLLMKQRQAAILTAAGPDIRETVSIYRDGDPRCCPSGGTKARIWHWNGSRLAAGPWKVTSGTPASPPVGTSTVFKTPSGNIVCQYLPASESFPAFLQCVIKSKLRPAPPRRPCQDGGYAGDRLNLNATGRVTVPLCAGDYGAYLYVDVARVLGYGKTWSAGSFSCTSAVTGLTCRNKSGHGFFLSRERWRRF